jgi:hypothetical protein
MACCSSDTQSVRLEQFVSKEIQDLIENGRVFRLGATQADTELLTPKAILGFRIKANLFAGVTHYRSRLARK